MVKYLLEEPTSKKGKSGSFLGKSLPLQGSRKKNNIKALKVISANKIKQKREDVFRNKSKTKRYKITSSKKVIYRRRKTKLKASEDHLYSSLLKVKPNVQSH